MKRYAIVRNARDWQKLEAYLPDNYSVLAEITSPLQSVSTQVEARECAECGHLHFFGSEIGYTVCPIDECDCAGQKWAQERRFVIEGVDVAGWTLNDYVIPRLASGLIWAEEVGLDHPIFKSIPIEAGQPDFRIAGNPGDTVFLLIPLTNFARDWVDENLSDDRQTLGRGIAVEHRYIEGIVEGIRDYGLSVSS